MKINIIFKKYIVSFLHPELAGIYKQIIYYDQHPDFSLDLVSFYQGRFHTFFWGGGGLGGF